MNYDTYSSLIYLIIYLFTYREVVPVITQDFYYFELRDKRMLKVRYLLM